MQVHGGAAVQFHSFLTSALYGGERPASKQRDSTTITYNNNKNYNNTKIKTANHNYVTLFVN